jgi:hypothetical protein
LHSEVVKIFDTYRSNPIDFIFSFNHTIKDLFQSNLNIIISGDITGALYSRGTNFSRNVVLLSNGYLYRFFVTDAVSQLSDKFTVYVSDLNVKGG